MGGRLKGKKGGREKGKREGGSKKRGIVEGKEIIKGGPVLHSLNYFPLSFFPTFPSFSHFS